MTDWARYASLAIDEDGRERMVGYDEAKALMGEGWRLHLISATLHPPIRQDVAVEQSRKCDQP